MGDLIERLNDAWRRLYADGDEHGVCDTIAEAAAALEAAREDAEKWRKCNATHDMGDGERIECHVIVGVNTWNGEVWTGFHQPESDVFFATLAAIDQARGIVPEAGQGVGK